MRRLTSLLVLMVLLASLVPLAYSAPDRAEQPAIRLLQTTFRPGLGEKPELAPGLTRQFVPAGRPAYFLVQFRGPILDAWRQSLENLGAEPVEYIPDFAYKVRMDPGLLGRVRKLDGVNWVGLFQPGYKLAADAEGAELLRVTLTAAADPAGLAAQIAALGATVQKADGRGLTVLRNGATLEALAGLEEVAWIEAEPEFHLMNNIARGRDGGMDAYAMWNLGVYGAGQIAAVADTSLDTNNPDTVLADFAGRVVAIQKLGSLSTDTDGHGTHVSGSVIGNGVNSGSDPAIHDYGQDMAVDPNVTTQKVTGIAPEASLYFQVIGCYHPRQGVTLCGLPSDLNTLFQPAYDNGARIHSNSWGSDAAGAYSASSQDVDEFMWSHPQMLVTTSAGNAGIDANNDGFVDLDSMGSPATAKNILAVGAIDNARTNGGVNPPSAANDLVEVQCSGNDGGAEWRNCWPDDYDAAPTGTDLVADSFEEMAAFSSRGPTNDGRIKPDVVAPGTNILSVMSSYATECGWGPGEFDKTYCMMGGTSMANPLTAGAATLVRDWYNDIKGYSTPSGALVKATLINTAVDIGGYGDATKEAGQPIPNNHEGWGRVNLANVAADRRQFVDNVTVGTGGVQSYSYSAPGGQPFKATLVWSDYPGSTTAAVALVNDLDLRVTAPGGTVYTGNVFSGGWSIAGGSADRVNNVENVYVLSAAAGTWTVEVRGFNVPYGPQPFALVVYTGGGAPANQPPTAAFSYACDGLSCNFDGSASRDADGTIESYAWAFGDGGTAAGATASHSYAAGAIYNVTLTVTDDDGASDAESKSVTVSAGNLPPTAAFTVSCTNLSCTFNGGGSSDADGTIVSYAWTFGDSTTASGVAPSHSYASAGAFDVTLTVTDNGGATDDVTQQVTVTSSQEQVMYVYDIALTGRRVGSGRQAIAVVTIRDTDGNPVPGATVAAAWSGAVSATVSGTTGSDGTVSFTSARVKVSNATFTFTVNNVTATGYVYDPEQGVTSATIVVP